MMKWITALLAVALTVVMGVHALAADRIPAIPSEFKAKSAVKLTILEFSAPWCASCKKLKPTVEALNKQYGSSLNLVHVNVDDPASAKYQKQFDLVSVPTYVLYNGSNKPIEKIEREVSAKELKDIVAKRIGS